MLIYINEQSEKFLCNFYDFDIKTVFHSGCPTEVIIFIIEGQNYFSFGELITNSCCCSSHFQLLLIFACCFVFPNIFILHAVWF